MSSNLRMPDRRLVWSSVVGIVVEVAYTLAMLGVVAALAFLIGRWAL